MINNILPVHHYQPRSVVALNGLQNIKKSSIIFVPKTSASNDKALNEMASAIKMSQNKDVAH